MWPTQSWVSILACNLLSPAMSCWNLFDGIDGLIFEILVKRGESVQHMRQCALSSATCACHIAEELTGVP